MHILFKLMPHFLQGIACLRSQTYVHAGTLLLKKKATGLGANDGTALAAEYSLAVDAVISWTHSRYWQMEADGPEMNEQLEYIVRGLNNPIE